MNININLYKFINAFYLAYFNAIRELLYSSNLAKNLIFKNIFIFRVTSYGSFF